jgi:hypothetical protein
MTSYFTIVAMCVIASQCATSPDGGGHANFVDTSVCRIVANPQNFDGKVVRFTADFESDGIERSVLVDPACSNQGIAPYEDSTLPSSERAEFDRAIYSGRPGTLDKQISAVFFGRFKWNAGHPHETAILESPAHSITLLHVFQIRVMPRT